MQSFRLSQSGDTRFDVHSELFKWLGSFGGKTLDELKKVGDRDSQSKAK
jgi:hypothetical protein